MEGRVAPTVTRGAVAGVAAAALQNLISLGHRAPQVVLDGLVLRHGRVVPRHTERSQLDVAGVIDQDKAEAADCTRNPRGGP